VWRHATGFIDFKPRVMEMQMTKVMGGCACGAVRYEAFRGTHLSIDMPLLGLSESERLGIS
jgi:hypothetical protein